eukprot:superscaffoldBa00003929_g17972
MAEEINSNTISDLDPNQMQRRRFKATDHKGEHLPKGTLPVCQCASVRTQKGKSLPLEALCVGNMTARPKPQSQEQQHRPDSGEPEPNCVSIKTNWTRDPPPHFKGHGPKTKIQQLGPDSPGPSCVPVKSDWSMDSPLRFQGHESEVKIQQSRPDSPGPSCVSMKSDWSMQFPLCFKGHESKIKVDHTGLQRLKTGLKKFHSVVTVSIQCTASSHVLRHSNVSIQNKTSD